MEHLPFGISSLPTNTQLTFLECPILHAVQTFRHWRQSLGQTCEATFLPIEATAVSLTRLHPLSFLGQRHLFIPTEGGWTAYFNNYASGTNSHSIAPDLAGRLVRRIILISAVPWQTLTEPEESLEFTVYDPGGWGKSRTVGLRNRAGFWRFWHLGEPLPFERVGRYRFRRRKRRFDLDLLRDYAAAEGIHPFDETFYMPGAALITCGPLPANTYTA